MRTPANRRYFGGVVAFNKADFEAINGFPNTFWGWGGEDDEMYSRIVEVCNLTPKHGANRNLDVTGTGHSSENADNACCSSFYNYPKGEEVYVLGAVF